MMLIIIFFIYFRLFYFFPLIGPDILPCMPPMLGLLIDAKLWFAGPPVVWPAVLGGVTGLPVFNPPYWYFAFFRLALKFEMNTLGSRRRTSCHPHYQTLRSNLVLKIMLLIDVWQRIHNRLLRPFFCLEKKLN